MSKIIKIKELSIKLTLQCGQCKKKFTLTESNEEEHVNQCPKCGAVYDLVLAPKRRETVDDGKKRVDDFFVNPKGKYV